MQHWFDWFEHSLHLEVLFDYTSQALSQFMKYSMKLGEKPLFMNNKKIQDADLCLTDVLHCEVEPDSESRVAGVRADEEVKLKLTDVVNTAKVPCRGNERAYVSSKKTGTVHNT